MKFGGTSVADAERVKRAARRIVDKRVEGNAVVAVLSARGKTTDELIAMAEEISDAPHPREMDMLLSSGERISCALCAMAINDLGHHAISLTGSQAGIVTDDSHTRARILDVRAERIKAAVEEGSIVLVAGFQGVSSTARNVTTLGRGGSDTTAVALASALDASSCELYTDVPGVFTADPRVVPDARRLTSVSFDEMLEMCGCGCPKPEMRAVEFARTHGVPLHVRSSFTWEPGTRIEQEDDTMEQAIISAVVHDATEVKLTVTRMPDHPGIAAALFRALADRNVNVDMIVQNSALDGTTDITFTVPKAELAAGIEVCREQAANLTGVEVLSDSAIAKVSLIGAGMKSNPGVAATMFEVLAKEDINIEMISTSPIRISCVVRADRVEDAAQALHAAFGLGERPVTVL